MSETPRSPSQKPEYFDPEYTESRHAYVERLRALAEAGAPEPHEDWDAVYVFSGPELTLDPAERPKNQENNTYNQTLTRLEAGFMVAKKVTALRLKATGVEKGVSAITLDDLVAHGPNIYFDGYTQHNELLANMIAQGELSKQFGFPDTKFIISGTGTKHTGDQFAHFPLSVVAESRKVVLVSDLYHIPRIEQYFGSKNDVHQLPREKFELYFHDTSRIAMKQALAEARKTYPYEQSGDLTPRSKLNESI